LPNQGGLLKVTKSSSTKSRISSAKATAVEFSREISFIPLSQFNIAFKYCSRPCVHRGSSKLPLACPLQTPKSKFPLQSYIVHLSVEFSLSISQCKHCLQIMPYLPLLGRQTKTLDGASNLLLNGVIRECPTQPHLNFMRMCSFSQCKHCLQRIYGRIRGPEGEYLEQSVIAYKGLLLATTFEFASAYTFFCALDSIFLTVKH